MVVQAQEEIGEGSAMPTDPHYTPTIIQPLISQPQKTQKPRRPKRKDTEVPQPSGRTTNVADKAVNEEIDDSLERTATTAASLDAEQDSGGGPKRQETMGDTIAQTRSENVSKLSNDPLLARGGSRTYGLKRLYKVGSSRRVESSDEEGLGEEDASKQGRIADINANEDIYLVNVQSDEDMFGVNDLDGDEVIVETEVASKDVNLSVDEVTLAQALAALKSAKPKANKVVIQEPKQGIIITTTAATTITTASTKPKAKRLVKVHDKGKRIMVEEPLKMKKIDQVSFDEQEAKRLQAEFDEEERLAWENDEANVALTEEWNDIQAKIDVDYQLAQRLQAQEQEELTDEEKARFSKRVREEVEKESSKKQKVEEDKESEELKQCLEIIPDDRDDVTIDATPLSTKSPTIVDYKIYKEGKKSYFQIIRADGNSQMYLTFGKMLKNFDREDLDVLWSIVKARFKKTESVNYMDNFLLLNLKTMFEHHVEDSVWKNQQGLVKVLKWELYDSYGVHCVTMQSILYYLLVEKMYPLTNHTLHQMFNDVKLQVDYECEMAFELLRLVKKQLKEGYVPE
ncbi:hypothetical protein Tco_1117241 [Tanacetum coccineum]